MGLINLTKTEKDSIRAIDGRELDKLIELAIQDQQIGALYQLPLSRCGSYVAVQLSNFNDALSEYRAAKSSKKRGETREQAHRAGSYVSFAFAQMKHRMEEEDQQAQLFYIFDEILPPHTFSKELSVRISYRWRRATEDDWIHGSIAFSHTVEPRPVYSLTLPKRKPSAAKQAQELQSELIRTWEHLRDTALFDLRDYFREKRDGSKIPKTFRATIDAHTRGLNNYSAKFWQECT